MPRDRWDKIDIVAKVVGSVLIAGSAVVVSVLANGAANDINQATTHLNEGNFETSLIGDLTSKESQETQVLALYVLDSTVGQRHPDDVVKIAESLYLDLAASQTLTGESDTKTQIGNVAYDILDHHDHQRALAARATALARVSAAVQPGAVSSPTAAAVRTSVAPTSKATVTTPATPTPAASAVASASPAATVPATAPVEPTAQKGLAVSGGLKATLTPSAPLSTRLVTHAYGSVVYIQYKGDPSGELATALRTRLQSKEFFAPSVEEVSEEFKASVRYFHAEDKDQADRLAGEINTFLKEKQVAVTLAPMDFTKSGIDVPAGQLEVWIDFGRQ
jgi:hypothetical protein